jgi:putative transposase
MARLPRLLVGGRAHLLSQRSQHGQPLALDDQDREALAALLRDVAAAQGVALHAYALCDDRFELLASAEQGEALSSLMQAVARRHAAAFNRRHARRGSLWEGRFRAAVVEPGEWELRCMVRIDLAAGADPRRGSLAAHVGSAPDPQLVAPAAYWSLGNTPFDREMRYRERLQQALTSGEQAAIDAALRGGWALGSAAFAGGLTAAASRPARPRPRGRPRRAAEFD